MNNLNSDTSFMIPLNLEQQVFATAVIDCIQNDEINLLKKHKTVKAKAYPNDIYRVSKRLAKSIDGYGGSCCLGFRATKSSEGLQISLDESASASCAAAFTYQLLKHFDIDIAVSIAAAYTCNNPCAAFVTQKGIKTFSVQQWLSKQTNAFNKKKKETREYIDRITGDVEVADEEFPFFIRYRRKQAGERDYCND